jgi:geranylgeranyl diphosphate synthase type I
MAAYSFGSCEAGGAPATAAPATAAPATAAGGKGLRQAPDVLGTEAAGASRGSGVTAAVAVEAVQTFALLHDDVMDGGSVRGRRSACAAVLPRTPREVTHRITGCVGQPLCHTKLLTP